MYKKKLLIEFENFKYHRTAKIGPKYFENDSLLNKCNYKNISE